MKWMALLRLRLIRYLHTLQLYLSTQSLHMLASLKSGPFVTISKCSLHRLSFPTISSKADHPELRCRRAAGTAAHSCKMMRAPRSSLLDAVTLIRAFSDGAQDVHCTCGNNRGLWCLYHFYLVLQHQLGIPRICSLY